MSNELAKNIVPISDSQALIAAIQSAASNPEVDVEKMERLWAMREKMEAKNAEVEFNAAMSRIQANMGRISADATNPQTRSQYATYAALDRALRPMYTREGLSLSFSTEEAPEGSVGMVCYVSHAMGHTRTYRAQVPSDGKGAKGNDVMTKTHAFGSGTSYGMRYLLKMIFNVAIGEDDDDGNGADFSEPEPDYADWIAGIDEKIDMAGLKSIKAELVAKFGSAVPRVILDRYNRRVEVLRLEA